MKKVYKNITSAVLLFFTVCSTLALGYTQIHKNKIELYVDELFFRKFNDIFLEYNQTIYSQFMDIYKTHRVSIVTLSQINQEAKEITLYLDELNKIYNDLYRNRNNNLNISEYINLIHSVIYIETLKLLNSSSAVDKNDILIPDELFKYFDDIQLKRKLLLIQDEINKFKNKYRVYLYALENKSGKNFIKDAHWKDLINELNTLLSVNKV